MINKKKNHGNRRYLNFAVDAFELHKLNGFHGACRCVRHVARINANKGNNRQCLLIEYVLHSSILTYVRLYLRTSQVHRVEYFFFPPNLTVSQCLTSSIWQMCVRGGVCVCTSVDGDLFEYYYYFIIVQCTYYCTALRCYDLRLPM